MQIAIRAYESAISGAVPDSTIEAIDRFFDLVDSSVDRLSRVLNRGSQTAEKHRARRGKCEVIDTEATPKTTAAKKPEATATSIVKKPHFYIVEAISPSGTLFVVTDGGNARTECQTREFAEKILRALEKAP